MIVNWLLHFKSLVSLFRVTYFFLCVIAIAQSRLSKQDLSK